MAWLGLLALIEMAWVIFSTALSLLTSYEGSDVQGAVIRALMDEEPLVRHTALAGIANIPPRERFRHLVPVLYDPVKAVRIEAARRLAGITEKTLSQGEQRRFEAVLKEYRQAMTYTADFAPSRHNLGNLYADLGEIDKAVSNYLAAIRIDDQFYPAKVNLAMLYNRQGKNDEAEKLLREVVQKHPDIYEVQYSLGLLLAERKKIQEASLYLSIAARGMPNRARVSYNDQRNRAEFREPDVAGTILEKVRSGTNRLKGRGGF